MKNKFLIPLAIFIGVGFALGGCGKRGGPFPPDEEGKNYPRQYPAPEAS